MSQCLFRGTRLTEAFKHSFLCKFFICVSLLGCAYVIYSLFDEKFSKNYTGRKQGPVRKFRYAANYTEDKNGSTGLIYILLWSQKTLTIPWRMERHAFIDNKCSKTNCYITVNRRFFHGDITKFDAIIFDGRHLFNRPKLPQSRSLRQKYIFFALESADNYPICNKIFDGFFNWTMTYKLDSDIVYPYFVIKNNIGEVVGPKPNMVWIKKMKDIDVYVEKRLRNKTKAAAWFVSNCRDKNRRDAFVRDLQKHLKRYNLTVDVYGKCGKLKCPKTQWEVCNAMLENDYYFYMALENSIHEDYITEKILTALQNNVVPIVHGGADYTRFLPPRSYLDAREHSTKDLAEIMYSIMKSQKTYNQFFKWRNHYTYHDATADNMCRVCQTLNDRARFRASSVLKKFRRWWNSEPCGSRKF